MKYLTLFLTLFSFTVFAQHHDHDNHKHDRSDNSDYETVEYKLAHSGGTLIVNGVANVEIESYNGSKIIITGEIEIHKHKKSDRSKGLKVLDSRGIEDNTGLGYSLTKDGGNLVLATLGHAHCDCTPVKIKLPKGIGLVVEDKTFRGDNLNIKNFQDPIDISVNNHSVNLENVTGPMAIKTLHGHIEANFTNLSQEGTINLVAVHGFVDVTIAATSKVDLSLKTNHGEIYSDIDIDISSAENREPSVGNKTINGKLNGGGVLMTLNSNFNEVYLRKK